MRLLWLLGLMCLAVKLTATAAGLYCSRFCLLPSPSVQQLSERSESPFVLADQSKKFLHLFTSTNGNSIMYVQYGTWPTSQSHRPPTTSPSPSTASPPGTIILATTRWTKAPTQGNPFFSSFTFDTHGTVQTCSAPASSPFCLALRPDVRVLLVSRGGLRLQRPWSPPPSLPQRLPRCATTTTNTMPVRMNLKLKVLVCGITKSAMYALFFCAAADVKLRERLAGYLPGWFDFVSDGG